MGGEGVQSVSVFSYICKRLFQLHILLSLHKNTTEPSYFRACYTFFGLLFNLNYTIGPFHTITIMNIAPDSMHTIETVSHCHGLVWERSRILNDSFYSKPIKCMSIFSHFYNRTMLSQYLTDKYYGEKHCIHILLYARPLNFVFGDRLR